jgi:hypothetical protein
MDSDVTHYYGSSSTTSTSISSTKATIFKNLTAEDNRSINFVALWRPNVLTINYYGNGAQYMNM